MSVSVRIRSTMRRSHISKNRTVICRITGRCSRKPAQRTHRSPNTPKKAVSWPSPQTWRTLIPEVSSITSLSAAEARANLDRLIDQVNADSEPSPSQSHAETPSSSARMRGEQSRKRCTSSPSPACRSRSEKPGMKASTPPRPTSGSDDLWPGSTRETHPRSPRQRSRQKSCSSPARAQP